MITTTIEFRRNGEQLAKVDFSVSIWIAVKIAMDYISQIRGSEAKINY